MVNPMSDFPHRQHARTAALGLAVITACLLAACGTTQAPGEPNGVTVAPLPPLPAVAPPPAPPAVVAPANPLAQQQAQKIAQSVADLLEAGNEDPARTELQRALQLDPANKLALNLQRQMTEDPITTLGRESFPYVVRSGDTMSRIAGRFLGDIYAFHILARYNNVKVPRQVGEGQTLRIPGKAPPMTAGASPSPRETRAAEPLRPTPAAPAVAPPAAPPGAAPAPAEPSVDPLVAAGDAAFRSGQAAAAAGSLDKALAEYKRAAGLGYPTASAQVESLTKRLVDTHSRNARTAMARQDLEGAIRSWDRVLEVDPSNETARLERQKALRLKDKVKAL